MNRNDMRSVVYLIIALICFYYLMDDFIGKNKITTWVTKFVGDFGGTAMPTIESPVTAPAAEPAPATAGAKPATAGAPAKVKDTGKIKIPQPEIDTGRIRIPQPQGAPKTKSGTAGGFSLNDLLPHFSMPFSDIPFGAPALMPAAVAAETFSLPFQIRKAFGG